MAVVQGSDPGLLRYFATGLRATATVMAGVSTTYMTLASIEAMKLKKGIGFIEAAENATRQTRIEDFQRKAKEYSEFSNSMFSAANAADTKAVTQEAASDASGFAPPLDFPDLPDTPGPPFDEDLPDNPDPIENPSGGGGQSGGGGPVFGDGSPGLSGGGPGLSGGGLGMGAGAAPYAGGFGDSGDGGAAGDPDAVADAPGNSEDADAGQQPDQGVLGLVPGGPVGVGAAALAAGGIAASVIWANRRNRKRHEDEGEERDRDGDKVEAVYQTGPAERPATG